jgi:hypothetical protein
VAFLKTTPGDVFAIPAHNKLGEIGFVLARHIDLEFDVPIFEVFSEFYTEKISFALSELKAERLFRPIMMILYFGKASVPTADKWSIIFRDENYNRDMSNFNAIQIGYAHAGGPPFRLWEGGKERHVSYDEAARAEWAQWWTPAQVSVRVSHHLAGLIGPQDNYSGWKINGIPQDEQNRPQLEAASAKAFDLALRDSSVMHEKFKQWAVEEKKMNKKKAKKV